MAGIPMTAAGIAAVAAFEISAQPLPTPTKRYVLAGTTRDNLGNALGNCTLTLERATDRSVAAQGASDASGVYLLDASPALLHQLMAIDSSGLLVGMTLPTLVGA